MTRIQHVSIPRPPGSHDQTRAFYGELLGLTEVPVPSTLAHLDLVWYRIGELELHCFAEKPVDDPSGRHFCLEIENLEEMRGRLEQAGYELREATPIPGRPRFFCRDPFNNIVEFTRIEGDYLEIGD
jgi:catechol 2,3-dioxygenase-like lactoylglutathione lyase family enzyme